MLFGGRNEQLTGILRDTMPITKGMLTVFIFYYWIESYEDVKKILIGVTISGCLAIFFGYINQIYPQYNDLFVSKYGYRNRFSILGFNYTELSTGVLRSLGSYGMYMSSASVLISSGFYLSSEKKKLIYLTYPLGILIGLFAVELSQSRSNLVSLFVGQSALLYFLGKANLSKTFKYATLFMLLIIVSYLAYSIYIFTYSFDLNTVYLRIWQFRYALNRYSESFLFGNGIINEYRISGKVIHNSYLYVLAAGGTVGFMSFMSLFGYGILMAKKMSSRIDTRNMSSVLICLILVLLVEMSLFGSLSFTLIYIIPTAAATLGKVKG
jgi:hypothetical protein